MTKIELLLLLAGVIPVLSQYNNHHDYQQPRYSDYGDFGRYNSNEEQQQGSDYALQQQSFFGSFNNRKNNNDNQHSASISSVIGGSGSYGGLTPPPPTTADQVNNVHKYYANERHAIVPSSLRELEESYIRSLSTGSGQSGKQSYVGPFGENRNHQQQRSQQDGVENYSGFIMTKRHYNKNDHIRSSQQQQYWNQFRNQNQAQQGAPITYGFPLLNQQVSATNSIDAPQFGRAKESGKFFDYSQKNIVPNFPDFSDRPPIPEEPDIPPDDDEEVEQATRKPPGTYAFPTPPNLSGFSGKPSPTPLSSPPPFFDPSFPDPVLQRGFIPSFGPPTKQPFFPLKPGKDTAELLHEQEFLQNQIASQVDVSTTSPVPVLRPEYPEEKETNGLSEQVSSIAPDSTEKPREGTIYKHISVHVPAEDLDEEVSSPKVIQVQKKPEKHIQVLFIKQNSPSQQKTEVEVPAGPQQKTLVYVLSESGGTRTPIKLVTPTPLKPAPPQVFFLRYTDPHTGGSHPTPSSTSRPSPTPPIKQLASPVGSADMELLRSAPAPVLPTFPSSFSSPASAIAQHLALQSSTITSPTVFTNTKFNNGIITDPTNSKYHGTSSSLSSSSNSLINDHSINNNNQLVALKYTNAINPPQSTSLQSQLSSNPFSQNYYSSLYHLYPPPVASASLPNQNLLSLYYNNPNNYQQYRQQLTQPQFYQLDQSKIGSEPTPSSIQGLYTVAPNGISLSGTNFNSLVQNPDGKNPPRSPRNYVMMNYAPTYMPNASGSDQAPVFTSPADFIKSLLGDSYMYYNNIANNNSVFYGNTLNRTVQQDQPPTTTTAPITTTSTTTTTTTTTSTTPAPPHAKSIAQAQHHSIPLIHHWKNYENLTSLAAATATTNAPPQYQQPFALLVGNSFNGADNNNNADSQFQNGQPVYPHLRPLFPFTSSTTTPKPQARISWAPETTPPPPPSSSSPTTPKQIIHLPVITYSGNSDDDSIKDMYQQQHLPHITTGNSVSSHFNNLFRNIQHDNNINHHHNSTGKSRSSRTKIVQDSEQSAEYYSQSESSSDETSEVEDSSSAQEGSSGEEIVPIHYEPTRTNSTSESGYRSSIIYVNSNSNSNNSNNNSKTKSSSRSRTRTSSKRGKSSRKRVNPAHVKPGRRLRKVRKPNKSRKNKENGEHATNHQTQSGSS